MGGQPVQEVVPLPEARRPQWVQPPADTAPELVVPVENAPRLEPQSDVQTAPEEARGRMLRRGPQLLDGTAMADTGLTGMGLGLSTGGLGGNGAELSVDDFCCPEYLSNMLSMIRQRWDPKQEATGETVVRFTIREDGVIDDVDVDRSSGYLALDQSAKRAILLTERMPRLPSAFTEDSLTVLAHVRVSTMKTRTLHLLLSLALTTSTVLVLAQPPDSSEPRQRSEVSLIIGDQIGAQPRLAVPQCLGAVRRRRDA